MNAKMHRQSRQPQPPRQGHRSTIIQLALLAVAALAALNYQFFLDQYALATFHPTAAVAAIQSRLGLTGQAKAIFAAARPQIDTAATFNTDCQTSKGELELGCFYAGRIYVLQIASTSLAPEMEVVMAHELLHAAWSRLSTANRSRLSPELEQVYHQLGDPDLHARMAQYAQTEPGQQDNELHSILGTEQLQLPTDLQQYYARYFTNRATIAAAHAAYQAVFDTQRQQLQSQLATIRALKSQLAVINQRLDAYRAVDQILQYNALIPSQNSLVDDINNRITTYTQGVNEYNALSKSLDSQAITDTESTVQ